MNKKPFLLFIVLFILISLYLIFRSLPFGGEKEAANTPLEDDTLLSSTVSTIPSLYEHWKPFNSQEHSFLVKFPADVDSQTFTVLDPRSKEKQYYDIFASQELDSTIYVINVIQFPPGKNPKNDPYLIEYKIQDIIANGRNSHLVSSKKTSLFDQDTTEFVIEGENYRIRGAMFVFEDKLYLLSMTASKKDDSKKDWDYFVKSFSIKKAS